MRIGKRKLSFLITHSIKTPSLRGINLFGDELEVYHNVHSALADKFPDPDLVVYLRASLETLMNRIAHRDRSYERNMERAYIAELMEAYDKFLPRINGRTAS